MRESGIATGEQVFGDGPAVGSRTRTFAARSEVLRRVPLFRDLDREQLEAVDRDWVVALYYEAGDALYRAGDPAETLFVVAAGNVKLLDDTSGGQRVLLDLLARGESFGSLLALGDEAYANDARAHTACCVLALSAHAFDRLLVRYPRVARAALEITARRLRGAQTVVRELSVLPVEGRLAAALLKLAERMGEPEAGGMLIQDQLPQKDLAAMTGTTPESVSRTLAKLRGAGILEVGRSWLLLKDRTRLQALAQGLNADRRAP